MADLRRDTLTSAKRIKDLAEMPARQTSSEPSAAQIRAQCERILASEGFVRSERQRAFLEFIVTAALEGRADRLKEFTLGIEVFEKDVDFDPGVDAKPFAKGLPASPGAASGKVVFSVDEAVKMAEDGEKVILVRTETSPEDFCGMHAAQAILTARGGADNHARK